MRAAVVGGGAYMVGKHVANKNAQQQDQAYQQGADDASQQQAPPQQYAAPAQEAPAAGGGMADELAKLKSLLDSGALTPDEYEAAKQKVIQG